MSKRKPKPTDLGTGYARGAADALFNHNQRNKRMMIELDGEEEEASAEEEKKKKRPS